LVKQAGADLIISLETQEALKSCYYASKTAKTVFLVNNVFSPIQDAKKKFSAEEIVKMLQQFSSKVILADASYICRKELGTDVVSGIYLIGWLVYKQFLPLKLDSIVLAVRKIIPEKFLELNLKAIALAENYEKI